MSRCKQRGNVSFHSFVLIDDSIYFSALNCNGLYKFNLNDETTDFIGKFPLEDGNTRHLHGMCRLIDRKIYFVPFFGKYISIYNVDEKTFDSIKIETWCDKSCSKYYDALAYKDSLLLIPGRSNQLISLNVNSKGLKYSDEWKKIVPDGVMPSFKNGSFEHDGSIYIPCCNINCLLRVNMLNISDVELLQIGNFRYGFTDAIFYPEDKEVLLLSSSTTAIVRYSFETKGYKEFCIDDHASVYRYPHIKMLEIGDKILILAYQRRQSVLFDKKTGTFENVNLEADLKPGEWGIYHYSLGRIAANEAVLMNACDNSLYRIKENMEITVTCAHDKQLLNHICTGPDKTILYEGAGIDLSDYIDYL